METFWDSTRDLPTRLRVGLSVAVTFLSVGTSAWIPRGWSREDVFLMRCSQGGGGRTTQLPHTVGGLAALGRHCPGGKPNDFTAWAAACDWYEELASDPALEEGPAEPVRRCIKISFSAPADLGSSEFLRDGFEAVVEPLEEFIDQWSGGTAGT
ncbi:hypothetical protein ACJ41O_007482 [Fusarium nematophilum]